jgi:hypothetical protein
MSEKKRTTVTTIETHEVWTIRKLVGDGGRSYLTSVSEYQLVQNGGDSRLPIKYDSTTRSNLISADPRRELCLEGRIALEACVFWFVLVSVTRVDRP